MRKGAGDSNISRTRISYDVAGNAKNGIGLQTRATQDGVAVAVSQQRALTTAATSPSSGPDESMASTTARARSPALAPRNSSKNPFTTRGSLEPAANASATHA